MTDVHGGEIDVEFSSSKDRLDLLFCLIDGPMLEIFSFTDLRTLVTLRLVNRIFDAAACRVLQFRRFSRAEIRLFLNGGPQNKLFWRGVYTPKIDLFHKFRHLVTLGVVSLVNFAIELRREGGRRVSALEPRICRCVYVVPSYMKIEDIIPYVFHYFTQGRWGRYGLWTLEKTSVRKFELYDVEKIRILRTSPSHSKVCRRSCIPATATVFGGSSFLEVCFCRGVGAPARKTIVCLNCARHCHKGHVRSSPSRMDVVRQCRCCDSPDCQLRRNRLQLESPIPQNFCGVSDSEEIVFEFLRTTLTFRTLGQQSSKTNVAEELSRFPAKSAFLSFGVIENWYERNSVTLLEFLKGRQKDLFCSTRFVRRCIEKCDGAFLSLLKGSGFPFWIILPALIENATWGRDRDFLLQVSFLWDQLDEAIVDRIPVFDQLVVKYNYMGLWNPRVSAFLSLLSKDPKLVRLANQQGRTPLMSLLHAFRPHRHHVFPASVRKFETLFDALLQSNSDVNATDDASRSVLWYLLNGCPKPRQCCFKLAMSCVEKLFQVGCVLPEDPFVLFPTTREFLVKLGSKPALSFLMKCLLSVQKSRSAGHFFRAFAAIGNSEVVQLFCEFGVSIESGEPGSGKTAFLLACEHGHVEIVRCLIARGCVCDVVDSERSNAFHLGVSGGKEDGSLLELFEMLFNEFPHLLEERNGDQKLVFDLALGLKRIRLLEWIVNHMKNPLEVIAACPAEFFVAALSTPLAAIVIRERMLVVRCSLLTVLGQDQVPLFLALEKGNLEVLRALIDVAGSEIVSELDSDGKSALSVALSSIASLNDQRMTSFGEILNVIEECGLGLPNLSSLPFDLYDLLRNACICGVRPLVVALLQLPEVCSRLDTLKKTPVLVGCIPRSEYSVLHVVCAYNLKEIAGLLLGAGASVNLRAPSQLTPLHVCAKAGNVDLGKLLISRYGAKYGYMFQRNYPEFFCVSE